MMEKFDYQGRRKDQIESSYKVMSMGCVGFFLVIVSIIAWGIVTNG